MTIRTLWLTLILAVFAVANIGCQNDDSVGDDLKDAGEAVGDAAKDTGEAVGDAAEDAADAVKDATN